jgi:hypothetical protein
MSYQAYKCAYRDRAFHTKQTRVFEYELSI